MGTAKAVGCGCVVGAAGLLVLMVLPVLIGAGFLIGRVSSFEDIGEDEYGTNLPECEKPLEEKWMSGDGDESDPKIAYIPIRGVIARKMSSSWLDDDESSCEFALRSIRAATRDKNVRGLYLFLDTPGGTVTDSDILADAVVRFRGADTNRFVFVQMGAMCCSGGYYVAAGADHIMAYPTTLTGSIGVIMNDVNAAELARKIGVKSVTIASGENKALLDPLEPVNPEHVKILKRPIEQDYARFVALVARGRKLSAEKVRPIADGRVLSAKDAKEAKLVDSLGYDEDARKKLAAMAHSHAIRIYRYKEPISWSRLFSSSAFMKAGRAFVNGMRMGLEASPRAEYRLR